MDGKEFMLWVLVILGALTFAGIIAYSIYAGDRLRYQNFQETIKDLSPEQKCMHICSFTFPAQYFENYKFCLEKCDRISEREQKCGGLNG